MCTLSFIPGGKRYAVAMNRDELFTRPRAKVATIHSIAEQSAIFPEDGDGGTWIAVNQAAITLAVLNWSTPPQLEKRRSRGAVIPMLIGQSTLREVERELCKLSMEGMRPFRMIGLFCVELSVREWRWDGEQLHDLSFGWERRHWFSSGLSDEKAAATRSPQFAQGAKSGEEFPVLRRLHSSHVPERGAFSVCVHREDAGSQSYTEVEAQDTTIMMRYRDGSPCLCEDFNAELNIPRVAF